MTVHPTPVGDLMKHVFRFHPAGIAIITAQTPEGPVGLTASSVSSVAVDPAAIMFSVTRATGSAGGLLRAGTIAVNLLDQPHAELAKIFSFSGSERFTDEQGWEYLPSGEPYLPDARATLHARILHTVEVGSSVVVIAEVTEIFEGSMREPVVYIDRAFRTLT